ncbi:MAG: SH3 domain-containing protein [Chloroflexi bacterium]|nr:SH3 domain-containing protein [Chloroflexota bacterium]
MAAEGRKCPYCGMEMGADQRSCPDCSNPYPFDDAPAEAAAVGPFRPQRSDPTHGPAGPQGAGPAATAQLPTPGPAGGRAGGVMELVAKNRTALVLVGVLVLIVIVAYVLFSVVMAYFGERRPDPSTATPVAGPVLVPTLSLSPVVGASPSPGTGTVISPVASPSPGAAGVRMKIANTEGQGANMRQRPSATAPVLRTLAEGTVVEVIGNETNADGRNWRNVRDGNSTGWVASELLARE